MRTIGNLMSRHLHLVPHRTPMRACLKIMRDNKLGHLPIVDDRGLVLGIVSDYEVSRACREGEPLEWVTDVLRSEKLLARPEDLAVTVLANMLSKRRDCVLVIDAVGRPAGLFTEHDALGLALVTVRPWMQVHELMTKHEVYAVEPDTPADEAEALLYERGVRHLLVVDGDELIGVLSHRDLGGRRLPVRKLLRRKVIAVRPELTVEKAAQAMLDKGVGCLPVVDESGSTVGILTRTDVLRAVARQLVDSTAPGVDRR